ncbi:MAG: hypothetical protein KC425_22275, partial [Anaerolineales bacterium]|nr:hypothetical protein [Anaerolineales bacterium]
MLASLVLTCLMALPYAVAYLAAPADLAFTGLIMNPEDSQTYFAKILQGFDGAWQYTIPFTPEPHAPALVGIFYVWLGRLARLLGLAPIVIWHAARVVAQLILFGVT